MACLIIWLLDVLPIVYKSEETGGFYRIDYIEDNSACGKIYCLTINTSDDVFTEPAFEALKDRGFNPEDYEIVDISDKCD